MTLWSYTTLTDVTPRRLFPSPQRETGPPLERDRSLGCLVVQRSIGLEPLFALRPLLAVLPIYPCGNGYRGPATTNGQIRHAAWPR